MFNSFIGKNVKLGDNVTIGHNCFIDGDIFIGDNTKIANNVSIVNKVEIGRDNNIFTCVNIGYIGEHSVYKNYDISKKAIKIGNSNIIRENSRIQLPYAKDYTYIGDNSYLMANVHIAHDCKVENNVTISPNVVCGGG